MANESDFHRFVAGRFPLRTVAATVPAGYTAGNRFTIAHGNTEHQGKAQVPDIVIPVAKASDADAAITAVHYQVVKVDDTNVTLRSDAAATTAFTLYIG